MINHIVALVAATAAVVVQVGDHPLSIGFVATVAAGLIIVLGLLGYNSSYSYEYKGKHVLITGGSSGIGLELAKEYLRQGANVTIAARDIKKLQIAHELLSKGIAKDTGQKLFHVSVDCGKSLSEVEQAFQASFVELGDVDVLVNCAGTSFAGAFDSLDPALFEHLLRVNVLGSIYPTRAVLGGMKRRGGGRIVFVSSQVAQAAIYGFSAYAASKWAIRGLAESLQMELKPFNILVAVSYPPDTDTPGYATEMETKPLLTKQISESGQVFSAATVARDIVKYSAMGYFGISTGLDGWLLKQLHPGMTPINSWVEVIQQVLFSPIARLIGVVYLLAWDGMVRKAHEEEEEEAKKKKK